MVEDIASSEKVTQLFVKLWLLNKTFPFFQTERMAQLHALMSPNRFLELVRQNFKKESANFHSEAE